MQPPHTAASTGEGQLEDLVDREANTWAVVEGALSQ